MTRISIPLLFLLILLPSCYLQMERTNTSDRASDDYIINNEPTAGENGNITVSNLTTNSLTLNWTPATDDIYDQETLEYKVLYSVYSPISTLEDAEDNCMIVQGWMANIATINVSNLDEGCEYFFNVIVRDNEGSETIYTPVSVTTYDETSPIPGDNGNLIITDIAADTMTVSWIAGYDNGTATDNLEYCVLQSTSNNISTVSTAMANGTAVMDWTADITTCDINGLDDGITYYFTVLIRDTGEPESNISSYDMNSAMTLDNTPPQPGNSGILTITNITRSEMNISWAGASDLVTPQANLEYKIVRSENNNIATAADAQSNGSTVIDWTNDLTSGRSTGLSMGNIYYHNVLVRDTASPANVGVYNMTSRTAIPGEVAKIVANGGIAADNFGYNVAVSKNGSTIAVANGGTGNPGYVYVFNKPSSGWESTDNYYIKLGESLGGELSVAISGDGSTIAIGNPRENSLTGAAYIYDCHFTSYGWMKVARITGTDTAAGHFFGTSVAISEDHSTIVVGSICADTNKGALYIYDRNARGWNLHWGQDNHYFENYTQDWKLTASDAAEGDILGRSVSISSDGSLVAGGAPYKNSYKGAVYLFKRGTGWANRNENHKLVGTGLPDNSTFGYSVSVSADGSTIAAGMPILAADGGGVYLFNNSGSQLAKITVTGMINFGRSVSLSSDGSLLLAGDSSAGSIYLFENTQGGISGWDDGDVDIISLLEPSDGVSGVLFGTSVKISGDGSTLVSGAKWDTIEGRSKQGSIYVYK